MLSNARISGHIGIKSRHLFRAHLKSKEAKKQQQRTKQLKQVAVAVAAPAKSALRSYLLAARHAACCTLRR
jgi:hypothetical protein